MTNTPSISVIVPVYKVEQYIKGCIDSILVQTFQDFEIILVDDASPDKSVEIYKKLYGDNEKIRLVHHEKNLGLGAARNTGMKHARGKYICFVDSDDFIVANAFEKFFTVAEKTDAQVVHAAGWLELAQNEPLPIRQENLQLKWDPYTTEGFLSNDVIYRLEKHWIKYDTWSMAWLCFCRRDFLEQKHIEFLNIISEDEPFNFTLLALAERYYILREALYIYRRRKGSIMTTPSVENFSRLIEGMIVGTAYIKNFIDSLPNFNGRDAFYEKLLGACIIRFSVNRTTPFYENLTVSDEINAATFDTLKKYFADGAGFVKFFFHGFHLHQRQAEIYLQQNQQFATDIFKLFKRLELSPRKIVFVNFLGRGYGCNPKYIAEEILRQNLPYDLVWLVNDMKSPMPAKIRKVSYTSLDAIYELATAKVIVSNVKNLLPFPEKKIGQYFIMTWHGVSGFKAIEKDAEATLSPQYVEESKINSAITDLMIADSQYQFDEFRRVFWYTGEILKCGLPSYDIFFRDNTELIAQVRKNLNVPTGNKIVMYAPTFRNDISNTEVYRFDTKKLLDALRKKFGGKWTLLMRFHPNVASLEFAQKSFRDDKNVINATNYPDVQELLVTADVLISDYSTVICDFMIPRPCKPAFILAKDLDTYPKERNLLKVYFKLPCKLNRTEAELFDCIKNFNAAKFESAVKKYLDKFKPFDTGHASEAVVEKIKSAIGNVHLKIQNTPPPHDISEALEDWKAYSYLRERYSDFLEQLPVYESGAETPKIFWWCWLQGENNAPPLCKVCLKSLRRNYSDYKINVVTQENISDFVSFPEHVMQKYREGKISRTHFSDLLRLELLINYGGIWIDSTVLCTGREQNYLREPLFIFQSTWRNAPAHLGSSWFIVACKDNPILKTTRDLLYKYWEDHDSADGRFYFAFHCMFKLAVEKYPEPWAKVPIFSNVPPHILQFEFFGKYNPDRFEQIKLMSHFHKLTWKYPPQILTPEILSGTNFEYVMKFLS